MKNLLTILLLLCFTMSAAGQMVRNDTLLRAAVKRVAAETTAQFADEIARLTDCSSIERLCQKPRVIYLPRCYMVHRGYPV